MEKNRAIPSSFQDGLGWGNEPGTMCRANFRSSLWDWWGSAYDNFLWLEILRTKSANAKITQPHPNQSPCRL